MTDPLLTTYLNSRDAPCPVCDYNLRGLKVDRCPECSAYLHLQVGSENTRLGAWLAAVMSFSLAVGFDAVMGLIVLVMFTVTFFVRQPIAPIVRQQHMILLSGFLALAVTCGGGIFMLVRRRRRWMMLSRRVQWRWAAVIFVIVFIVHLLAGFLMARML